MSENGMTGPTSNSGFGSSRHPYDYGPGGRLVLVDSALEAVNRGSTTS
jgi:proteasome alpha subunit